MRRNCWHSSITALLAGALAILGACASHTEIARLGTADYGKRFEEQRKNVEDLDYSGLLSKLAIRPATDQGLPFDATQARYFPEAARALLLSDAEVSAFKRNGFVMVDHDQSLSMGRTYLEIYKADLPVFVSVDSILHALHRSYDQVLMGVEVDSMIPALESVLASLEEEICPLYEQPALRESATDLMLYTTVARKLLARNKPEAKSEVRLGSGGTSNLGEVLEKIGRQQADDPDSPTSLYGRARVVDWSQFRPRGHYVHNPALEAYFGAMMWMGRVDLAWHLDIDRELRDAALLVWLVKKTGQSNRLAAMSRVLDFMVGRADSTGLTEMEEALRLANLAPAELASSQGLHKLRAALQRLPATPQQIRSETLLTDPGSSQETRLPLAFQLLGQRFVLDAFVLSKVVYDAILFHGRKQDRSMPTGLDVMAALGSNEAILQLEPQLRQYNYAANLLAARRLLDGLPSTEWQSNAYTRWLEVLRQLFRAPDSDKLPSVMQSREWQRKELQTAAASWAELRHDTVLYAKQSYSGSAICEYPEGYVEPYPAVFAGIGSLARTAATVLSSDDLYPQTGKVPDYIKQMRRRRGEFFERFAKIMDRLEGIAVKELRSEPLDDEQKKLLKDVIVEHKVYGGCSSFPQIRYTGWYADLYYNGGVADSEPTVADVHTDPDSRLFLEEGVGNARYLLVAVDNQQDRAVYVGPAYSYYEFTSPVRLTDEEWEKAIPTTAPASFTTGFALPSAQRSVAYPPKAPPPAPLPQSVPPPSPLPDAVGPPDFDSE